MLVAPQAPAGWINAPSFLKNVAVVSLKIVELFRNVKLPLDWLSIPAP
jgi:hypothetical protein